MAINIEFVGCDESENYQDMTSKASLSIENWHRELQKEKDERYKRDAWRRKVYESNKIKETEIVKEPRQFPKFYSGGREETWQRRITFFLLPHIGFDFIDRAFMTASWVDIELWCLTLTFYWDIATPLNCHLSWLESLNTPPVLEVALKFHWPFTPWWILPRNRG